MAKLMVWCYLASDRKYQVSTVPTDCTNIIPLLLHHVHSCAWKNALRWNSFSKLRLIVFSDRFAYKVNREMGFDMSVQVDYAQRQLEKEEKL